MCFYVVVVIRSINFAFSLTTMYYVWCFVFCFDPSPTYLLHCLWETFNIIRKSIFAQRIPFRDPRAHNSTFNSEQPSSGACLGTNENDLRTVPKLDGIPIKNHSKMLPKWALHASQIFWKSQKLLKEMTRKQIGIPFAPLSPTARPKMRRRDLPPDPFHVGRLLGASLFRT